MLQRFTFTFLLVLTSAIAQTPAPASLVGTVGTLNLPNGIDVKPDNGAAVSVKLSSETVTQRVAPGQTDLRTAQTVPLNEISGGDRVLVTLDPTGSIARRIIIMAATDIAKRNAADRQDWTRRGVSGVVAAKTEDKIQLKTRTLSGEVQSTVNLTGKTYFRRYKPDSVKFSDAQTSSLEEVKAGDQLRARGLKSADGLTVEADEVVFGTFLNLAGSITAVNPAASEVTIKDLTSNKSVVVRFTPDSQVKRMPDMAAMAGMMRGGAGAPPAGAPAAPRPAAPPPSAPAAAPNGPAAPPTANRGPDIAQLVESMPPTKMEDLKPGETIVVAATKGARADQVTAILFLANADILVQLASRGGAARSGPPPSLSGLASSIGGI